MLKNILAVLIFSFIISGCTSVPVIKQNGNNQLQTTNKHALLIGIENYNHPEITNLKGAINDVKLTQGMLRSRFGFQDSDFIILLDQQATHSGIENAFKKLIKRVKPKDFVYIYYAGHGSQTKDLNGDEPSGYDQTWTSFKARQHGRYKDNYEVLDDEIKAWLAEIYAKTDQVIFVSDSCHSATVARGKVPVTRGVERDERSHLLGKKIYKKLREYHGIHIGAARDKEFAAETIANDGKDYGLFTWHWVKALQQAQKGDTWNEVFKRAYTQVVGKRGQAQRPQLEGKRHRQVFGGHLTPPVATVSVSEVKGKKVKIQAGATAGVTVGSIYHQHPQNRASLKITKVGNFESEGTASGRFKLGDNVLEKSHAYHFDPIKVYLAADYPKDQWLLQSIRAAFSNKELPGYVLTNKPDKTDLRLQVLRPKRKNGQVIYAKNNDALPKSFANQAPEIWILTPDQHLLHKKLQIKLDNPNKGLELVKYNLNHNARVREIKALQNHDSSTITVQTDILTPCTTGRDCIQVHNLGLYNKKASYNLQEIGKYRLNKDDILTFTLHNNSREDYYCYLINITPDGSIYAIYPNPEEGMEYARVKAKEQRSLSEEVVLILKNLGEQTIKLIATTNAIDISLLEKEGFKGRNLSDLNPLERLLVSAAHGERGELLRMSNDEWFTEQVVFEVNK